MGKKKCKAVVAALCLAVYGCAYRQPAESVSPANFQKWEPPARSAEVKVEGMAKPSVPPPSEGKWGLTEVVDLALKNNPATSAAWYDALSASARLGAAESADYPKVSASVSANFKDTYDSAKDFATRQVYPGAALTLSWLIMDFGSRDASKEAARYALVAANLTQNKAIEDVVLQTAKAYYLYMSAKALREAREKAVEKAASHLKAAEARKEAGVATISDVLSAKTALSQANLALQTVDGSIATTRGSLAVAMGIPANTPFDIEEAPKEVSFENISADIDSLIDQALKRRTELAISTAQTQMAEANARKAEGDLKPSLTLGASTGVTWYEVNENRLSSATDRREDLFSVGVTLNYPLFTGYQYEYEEKRARYEAQSARERETAARQRVINQVYNSYHALKTASQKAAASGDLLASAERSEEVALARYKEGVGTIVELLSAQAALSDARSQVVQARWEWYSSLAQLQYDTGLLGLHGETGLKADR